MEIVVAFLIFLVLSLAFSVFYLKNISNKNNTSDLINFSESLTSQIQEVRKEIDKNSKDSRVDIESKLIEINKQMNDFTKSSSENMSNRFKQSDQVMKEVTTELEKIKGVKVAKPKGAFYCIVELPVTDSDVFAQWLLEDFRLHNETIMVAPAAGFYSTEGFGKNQVRIAYVLNKEDLRKSVAILKAALTQYNA